MKLNWLYALILMVPACNETAKQVSPEYTQEATETTISDGRTSIVPHAQLKPFISSNLFARKTLPLTPEEIKTGIDSEEMKGFTFVMVDSVFQEFPFHRFLIKKEDTTVGHLGVLSPDSLMLLEIKINTDHIVNFKSVQIGSNFNQFTKEIQGLEAEKWRSLSTERTNYIFLEDDPLGYEISLSNARHSKDWIYDSYSLQELSSAKVTALVWRRFWL